MIDQEDLVEDSRLQTSKFLLTSDDTDHSVDPETQARLEALLQAAGNVFCCIKIRKEIVQVFCLYTLENGFI